MNIDLELLLNKPIKIKDIGTLYQPTIDDIYELGIEEYNKIVTPYRISLSMLKIDESQKKIYKNFDLLFMETAPNEKLLTIQEEVNGVQIKVSYLDLFQKSLEFFLKEDIKFIPVYHCFKIGEVGLVHRDNFDELADIMLKVCTSERIKVKKEPDFKSERQKSVWEKLKKGREKNAKKNEITIPTIINDVMFGGKSYISDKQICDMTMWQLINAYKSILNIDSFYLEYKKYIAGVDPKNLDLTHWSERLKIK